MSPMMVRRTLTQTLRSRPREALVTAEFEGWFRSLGPERQAAVSSSIARIAKEGPTIGRPRVDVIHGSRLRKLKEARVDRGTRLLFAFDSNRNVVMLVGGDKTGKWNRWYPPMVKLAERLYLNHERSIGKEVRCRGRQDVGRTSSPMGR
jgi:hypothetical protein